MNSEELRSALRLAFNLGQTYWQQADSDYTSQWKKADVTLAKFKQLVEDTVSSFEENAIPKARG
jgi:hypothetical protein